MRGPGQRVGDERRHAAGEQGDDEPAPAAAAALLAPPTPRIPRPRRRECPSRPPERPRRMRPCPPGGACRAPARRRRGRRRKASASLKRASGSLASARITTASRAGGMSGLIALGRRGRLGDLLERDGDGAVSLERDPSRQCLVEDHPDRVDVRARRRRLALRLLRREVLRRPHHGAGGGDVGVLTAPGDAEVGDAGAALVVDQDVLRLQVAVDDPLAVGEAGGVEDLPGEVDRVLGPHPALDQVLQRGAVDVLHGDEVGVAEDTAVEDPDHVRVLEPGRRLRLALEALDELLVLREAVVQDLDRHVAVELGVLREPDVRHPARADLPIEPVALVDHRALARIGHQAPPCRAGSRRPP